MSDCNESKFIADRKLLELAAKAAGYNVSHQLNGLRMKMNPPVLSLVAYKGSELLSTGWNPLDDDGSAFRLGVKLKMDIIPKWGNNCVCIIGGGEHFEEPQEPDICAAMRRAIVRAAAFIGERK